MHDDDRVEGLVVELLDHVAAGRPAEAALGELCASHPGLADSLRRRAAVMREFGLLAAPRPSGVPERLGEFTIRRRLGGGGMGVVFLAEQERLGREVAVKVVHPAQLLFAGARERFRREVEAVARLQHPGIVPVHAVGEQDGIPYLAMELVRGGTLAEVLAALRGRRPQELSGADMAAAVRALVPDDAGAGGPWVFEGPWEDACLRVARQVAEALQHAHARGVVHRDVKPSNVMLTPDGRARLLDFGLAAAEGSESLTRTGSPLGSLPYMSPEQTRGEAAAGDPRTDVYALGVLLFELLTLRPAFAGGSAATLVAAIQQGRREAPRALNPALSWEAETVCLTAMDPDPARRYASAADLARDLANVLERRPLEARRAGALLAARRWVQRHPTASVAVALGALLLVGGPSAWAWQQHRAAADLRDEQERTKEQRDLAQAAARDAEAERARAAARLEDALAAVDTMLVRVGDRSLKDVPQMQALRRGLLDEAVALHRRFLEQEGEEPRLVLASARALLYSGNAHLDAGDTGRAEALYAEAIGVLERVLEARPGHAEAETELARALRAQAASLDSRGHVAEATALNLRAIELQRRQGLDEGASREERYQLGVSLNGRTATVWRQDPAGAEAAGREALAVFAALAAEVPDDFRLPLQQGRALGQLAVVAMVQGRAEEARARYDDAIVALDAALALRPEVVEVRQQLARTLVRCANVLSEPDPAAAEAHLARASSLWEALVRDFPETPDHRADQAQCLIALANLCSLRDDWPATVAHVRRAEEAQAALVERVPESASYRTDLVANRCNLVQALLAVDDVAGAREAAGRAVATAEGLLAGQPGGAGPLGLLSLASYMQGLALQADGQPEAAEAALVRALDGLQQALAVDPGNADYAGLQAAASASLEELRAAAAAP